MLSKLFSKIQNVVRRAYVTLTNNDDKDVSIAQVSAMEKVMDINTIYPYGLYAQAPLNSMVLLFSVQGNEENLAGICYSYQERFKNLKPGEVLLGNVLTQTFIKMDKDGNIVIDSKKDINATVQGNVNLTAQQVNIDSPAIILGNNPGSAVGLARVGDQVKTTIGGIDYIGTIITGSAQNKSN